MGTTGVLLMAYGGPNNLEDIEPYLLDIRGGRPTSPELIAEIKNRYAMIGGSSPLLRITQEQAASLEVELNRRAGGSRAFEVYVGMRHWEPRILDAVAQMRDDGIRQAVALVMAPHYSKMSTGMYLQQLEKAVEALEAEISFTPILSWHDRPGLIAAIAENARHALGNIQDKDPYVLFAAHSLPERILAEGDPYPDQLLETAQLVAQSLDLPRHRWEFCFQSAGQTREPWLGPQIEEVVLRLARLGEDNLLVVPIGFVADHVEVLYDIDIEAKQLANQNGASLVRSASLNTSPTFIAALASLVLEAL